MVDKNVLRSVSGRSSSYKVAAVDNG